MQKKIYRTAIYARLSKDDGDKAESNSIVSQRSMCEEYIRNHDDLELAETFTDDGYSGVDFERPGFRKMEAAVRAGQIDAILCKDLSRVTRNYIEGGRYLEKIFPALGVRFIAINDGYDTLTGNPQSDSFIIPFKNLINDTYCKDISVKIRTNLDVKRRKGEYVGAYTPYGYKKDEKNRSRLIVDEYAGDIVRQIFSKYKDGMSIGRIAEWLNDTGVLSPMEYKISEGIRFESTFRAGGMAKWSYTAVRRILTNEVYIGILAQGKRGTPNYKVHEVREKSEEEWIRVEDAHEALVTHDDFMAVRDMLKRDTRMSGDDLSENTFSGFLFCKDCGQPMVRKTVPGGKKQYHYYVCSTNRRHDGCSPHSISAKKLDKAVTDAMQTQIGNVLDLSGTMEYIDSLPAADRETASLEMQAEKLKEEIEHCRRMKLRIYEDMADGMLDKAEYADFKEHYSGQIEEKTAALERIDRDRKDALLAGEAERTWVTLFKQYENIEQVTRRALMALVDRIYIYEGHSVELLFRYGDEYRRASEYVQRNEKLIPQTARV